MLLQPGKSRCHQCVLFRKNLHGLLNKITMKKLQTTEIHEQPTQQPLPNEPSNEPLLNEPSNEPLPNEPSIEVNDEVHAGLLSIAENNEDSGTSSFGQLFWHEQLKNIRSVPNGRRWHPLLIKWCLYMHHLSSSSYNLLRNSGYIVLPSGRTLRDYTHYIDNKPGFQNDVDEQLCEMIGFDSLQIHEKYVCIVADEMKIKEGLVFNKKDGDLIGFTNIGNVNEMLDRIEKNETPNKEIATSMFVLMVRGLIKGFNFPYASFPSSHLSGNKIASILMEATFRLERMGLKVMAHTLDGCLINRKYFRLMSTNESLPYKTKNPFTSENRHIYFISDPPHLIKTTRNCLYNPRRKLEVITLTAISV